MEKLYLLHWTGRIPQTSRALFYYLVLAQTGSSAWCALSPFSPWPLPVTLKNHFKSQLPFKAFLQHPCSHPGGFLPSRCFCDSTSVYAGYLLIQLSPLPDRPPQGQGLYVFIFVDAGPGTQALERCVRNTMRC